MKTDYKKIKVSFMSLFECFFQVYNLKIESWISFIVRLVYLNLFSSGPEDELMVEQALKSILYIDKMLHMPSLRDNNSPNKSHHDGMKVKDNSIEKSA
jgi:hypothetical protein